MPFDQPTRNRLARFVGDARRLLSAEFTRQLQQEYGLDPTNGAVTPLERLSALDDARRETARILRETLAYYLTPQPPLRGGEGERERGVLERIVREQAFTVLNRLCALRMAEARGLIRPAVAQGYQSTGFQLYARLAGSALGETGAAYRAYLYSLCDELAVELLPLFDRFSPQGRLFPRESALLELLEMLNAPELEALWAEDETTGWIYQYFNSKEERKAMRDASSAPRDSRELAVRNQFFTPRYVVEFLTDNTLGRIWYEMTQGKTGLKDSCRYLVRRPNEIFLAPGEAAPPQPETEADLSQEELLRQPVYIPHRPLKDPRDILMLDPACGSLHFGLYAFDLYELIYREAWEIEAERGAGAFLRSSELHSLHETYPDQESFLRDMPRLIVEHNIHGIDIDPRATQIAGLSLWLRAQKSWQAQGLKPGQRPTIRKANIVCAEPMPGDRAMLEEFLAELSEGRLEDLLRQALPGEQKLRATKAMAEALKKLVRTVWQEMELAGEAGSLLKIEETLQEAVDSARKASEEKAPLFRMLEYGLQAGGQDASGGPDFWSQAEALTLAALHSYAEGAANGQSYRRRLFAGDAVQGFAFIDLFRKRYDVALMNPPFGDSSITAREYIHKQFSQTKRDLGFSFIDRFRKISVFTGQIVSRTSWFLSSFEEWRKALLREGSVVTAVDLGFGVLDAAMVETVAFIYANGDEYQRAKAPVFRLLEDSDRETTLNLANRDFLKYLKDHIIFLTDFNKFLDIEGTCYSYWAPPSELRLLMQGNRLHPTDAYVHWGLFSADDYRFLRLWPEISAQSINLDWISYAKGGDYAEFYAPIHLVVLWRNSGREIRENKDASGNTRSRVPNSDWYFKPGLTYSSVTIKGMAVRALPAGCIFSIKGPGIIPLSDNSAIRVLSFLNSRLARRLMTYQTPSRSWDVPLVRRLPTTYNVNSKVMQACQEILERKVHLFIQDELNRWFQLTDLSKYSSILCFLESNNSRAQQTGKEIISLQQLIDDEIDHCYEIQTSDNYFAESGDFVDINDTGDYFDSFELDAPALLSIFVGVVLGRWDIRYATGAKPTLELPDPFASLPACPPGMLQNAQGLPAVPADVPADYPLRISWPGILVDDPGHPEDVAGRVREALQVIWGESADAIEQEACQILGVGGLGEYFRKPGLFFADHLKRYSKSRRVAPIYWPLSTPSGSYTLWLYYHRLSDQMLFTCVNDFVDPKQKQVGEEAARLRRKTQRSAAEEKELERLSDFEGELKDFRTELLRVAAFWKPNLNDGVEITAAPLWRLFQHKPWQKRLKETWGKLEQGEYDWAPLAYSIWPERVREKCRTDKSLAIAHGVEELYVEKVKVGAKKSGRKKKEEPEMESFLDE